MSTPPIPVDAAPGTRRSRWVLLAILALCVAPVVASYLAYYLVKPDGRTNYGELLDPPRAVEGLVVREVNDAQATFDALRGKWVLLTVGTQGCDEACAARLYSIRQVRLTTGKERDRVHRVLLLSGNGEPAASLLAEHEGLRVWRADADLARWLPPAQGGMPQDHIFVIDPLGNVMLRFPRSADPSRMKKDIARLLRASRVG